MGEAVAPSDPTVAQRLRLVLDASEAGFIVRYGRKFTLSLIVIAVGAIMHLVGILTILELQNIERAREITEVVKSFHEVIIAAILAFSGADALITMKTGALDPVKAGPGPNKPPPRASGMIDARTDG